MSSNKDLKYSINLKDNFNKTMSSAISNAERLDAKMSSLSNRSSGFWNMETGLMSGVTAGNLLAGAIQKTAGAIIDFEKDSIRAFGQQEQFLASLKTMFHGNTTEAELLNKQLKNFATTTPFELTEIQDATKMMIAYGSKSQDVVEEMRMLGDISSGVGSSLSEVGYLYGTLRTQGRAFSKDIYQFTGRGIPIVKELAKQFKVTDDQVMELAKDGKIGFKDVEKAFQSMTREGGQFFDMMKNQSQTLNGQISNMSDAWEQLKSAIGESQSEILKETVAWVTSMIGTINSGVTSMKAVKSRLKAGGGEEFNMMNPLNLLKGRDSAGLSNALDIQFSAANKSLKNALNQRILLYTEMKAETDKFKKGELSEEDFDRRMAIYKGFDKELTALIDLKRSQSGGNMSAAEQANAKNKSANESSSKKSLGSSTEISATRPQSLVINIGKMVEKFELHSTNVTEGFAKIKDKLGEMLVEVANDANIVAKV